MADAPIILPGSVQQDAFRRAVEALSVAADTRAGDTAELVQARLDARGGNPESLIGMLWPQLIIDGEES